MKNRIVALVALFTLLMPTFADEGMWLLPQLKQQNSEQLKKAGLAIDVDDLYQPNATSLKDAVVIFGGGCTGEIISSQGLVLTNHHCGYSAIQNHSTVEHNYLQDGFWAYSKKEELPNPDLKVQFIDQIEDVTAYVQEALVADTAAKEMDYLSASYLNKLARTKIGESYLKEHPYIEVTILPFYAGNSYYMFTKKIYEDVRLVGAPSSSIGKFGADTDNWMWPRHTGDFSLFRIYTDSLGNPAKYASNNIPLVPKKHFTISLNGVQEGDFAMIMGFPGRTNRFYTSAEVTQRKEMSNAPRISLREVRQNVLLKEMLNDPKVKIQYASKYSSSTNYYKNAIGMNRGIDHMKVVEQKKQQEYAFRKWAILNDKQHYIAALGEVLRTSEAQDSLIYQMMATSELIRAVEFSGAPRKTEELVNALKAKDQAAIDTLMLQLREDYNKFANKDYNAAVDAKVAKAVLAHYATMIAPDKRPEIFKMIDKKMKGSYDKYVDHLFEKSIFASSAAFEKFMQKPSAKLLEKDPISLFAKDVWGHYKALREKQKDLADQFAKAEKIYVAGLLEMRKDTPLYPDANSTIRLTYGNVRSYSPANAIDYKYYTTLEGVMEKEDSTNWEFVVPHNLKEAFNKKDFSAYALPDGKLPVNFLTTNDITGGNSGSPVLNSKGEIIGLAFDGNWEAMSGDIVFEPTVQRTINCDIRYVLFVIEKLGKAVNLIEEMTLGR